MRVMDTRHFLLRSNGLRLRSAGGWSGLKRHARAWLAATLAVGALGTARAGDVYWSIGIHQPGVSVGVSNTRPVVVAPPVVVSPPVWVAQPPRPVVVAPPAVVVTPAPPVVYYYGVPPGHRKHHRHHHERDGWRDDDGWWRGDGPRWR
jgi:hypothetical protein